MSSAFGAPPSPIHNWSGFYVGASAGYGWGDVDADTVGNAWYDPTRILQGSFLTANAFLALLPPHFSGNSKGFIGGGQIGYNYQVNRFVWGIEADFSGANISGSSTRIGTPFVFPDPYAVAIGGSASESHKLDFFGTVRGRLGFTPSDDRLLVYATGGLAYGHVRSTTTLSDQFIYGNGSVSLFNPGTITGSASAMRYGWTVGGGAEYALPTTGWSVKAEYLYYDLGDVSYTTATSSTTLTGTLFTTTNAAVTAHFKGNIVRAGINYHF